MRSLDKKQIMLLFITPLLCISMLILIPSFTVTLGKTVGYVTGFCTYWLLFCIPVSLYSCNGFSGLKRIYSQKSNISTTTRRVNYLMAFIPCIATFMVVFKEFAPVVGFQVLAIALLLALINGTFEEMFWRGVFNKVFYIYVSIIKGHMKIYPIYKL